VTVRGRRALAGGFVLTGLYLALASVSAHVSPLDRRPLLDGLAPPPPYRWVSPPPGGASAGRPSSGSGSFTLAPGSGLSGGVVSTGDLQATVVLPSGAAPAIAGARSVVVAIRPVAALSPLSIPKGLTITGNLYLVRVTLAPSGGAVARLDKAAEYQLVYPSEPNPLRHTMLHSPDGRTWTALTTSDQVTLQRVTANSRQVGYFAAAESNTPAPGAGFSAGRYVDWLVVGLLGIAVLWVILRTEYRARRAKRSARRKGARPPR
jgi:hypothetical protein